MSQYVGVLRDRAGLRTAIEALRPLAFDDHSAADPALVGFMIATSALLRATAAGRWKLAVVLLLFLTLAGGAAGMLLAPPPTDPNSGAASPGRLARARPVPPARSQRSALFSSASSSP